MDRSELYVETREEWRSWLEQHHNSEHELWLVFYKKSTGKTGMSYTDSVAEALCFGWIDGLKKGIDEQRYAYRFTPRKLTSKWSPSNIRRATQMIDEGRMTAAGLKAFDHRVDYSGEFLEAKARKNNPLPT